MSKQRKAKQIHPTDGQRDQDHPQILEVSEWADEAIIAKSFIEELDLWTYTEILSPLVPTDEDGIPTDGIPVEICDHVKEAIRKKVLESYRNGCRAGRVKVEGDFGRG